MAAKNNFFVPVLAFLISICSLVAVPLISTVAVQQKTETVNNQQPLQAVRLGYRFVLRDVTNYGPVLFELHTTPTELHAFPRTDVRLIVEPPVLPVMTHRPFT
jgi:hypothetical protein